MRPILFFFLLISGSGLVSAQSDAELAIEYFRQSDCEKGINFAEKALEAQFSKDLLSRYTSCAVKAKKGDAAVRFFRNRIRTEPERSAFYSFQWGSLLAQQGKDIQAGQKFDETLQILEKRPDLHPQFIEDFRKAGNPDYARKIIQIARERLRNPALYALELAAIYQEMGDKTKMIGELLGYGRMVRSTEVVQNLLQDFLKDEKDGDILERMLYEQIQAQPNEVYYNELLVWLQIQRKDFYKAFLQERSLDKRLKSNGARIINLATLAVQNQDYANALKMYEYLQKEYQETEIYPYARRMALLVQEEQIKRAYPVRLEDVRKLIGEYEKFLAAYDTNINALEAIRNMAKLYAFYLNEPARAVTLLSKAVDLGKTQPQFADACKLDLGDIYLLNGEPWEASLLYSQVEKSQKDNALGYEAKLRNARLYYFKGEFDLARSVLNVLKKATSREIANDASILSMLILDNTGMDSSEDAMRGYAAAELLLFQHQYDKALDSLSVLYTDYKDHALADEILWMQASVLIRLDRNEEAEKMLLKIIKDFSYDILADNAMYELAQLYESKLNRKEDAMRLYQELMDKYPASIFVADARKRYRMLRGDVIN
ncbi:tetratricopeptide repeat protein [Ravibacter arvi]